MHIIKYLHRKVEKTQGLNPGLLHCCRQILYHLSHQGSPHRKVIAFFNVQKCLHNFNLYYL